MSTSFQDIDQQPNGARFYTADLHVHSYGGSADVKDASMTVNAIIDEALQQKIGLLSITDHNSIVNVQAALDYASQFVGQLLVLPGVEVTTAHGHLLVYFPPSKLKALTTFLGKIDIKGDFAHQDLHTELSMASVIGEAERLGGVCVAAHIDRTKTGFESVIQGYPNSKSDIVRHSGLYGVEVDDPQHLVWYSEDDEKTNDGGQRTRLFNLRTQESSTQGRAHLAHIQNSDAHSLQSFRDQSAKRTLTKYKMNELSFEAFRMALIDPGARIRTQVNIPPLFPRVLGMHIEGSFLDGQMIHFADNLNCFFGGRGTGKSTAIQSLAYGLGLRSEIEGYDNCPDSVVVYCEDDAGTVYCYIRQKGFDPDVKAKTGTSSISDVPADAFRVEFYGQGELAEVAKDPLKTPELLQRFLDKHLSLTDLLLREAALIHALDQNSAQLIPLEASAAQLVEKAESLKQVEKKLQIAQEGKVSELADLQTRLTAEKTALSSFNEFSDSCKEGISLSDSKCDVDEIIPDFEKLTKDPLSTPLFNEIVEKINQINAKIDVDEKAINTSLRRAGGEIDAILLKIKARHVELNRQIGVKVSELQKKGLTASVVELTSLLKQKTNLTSEITRIKGQSVQLKQYRANRSNLLAELRGTRDEIVQRRKSQLQSINQHLGSTVRDYSVNVHYDPSGLSR